MWHRNVERRIIAHTDMQSKSHYSDDEYEDDDDYDNDDDILFTLFLSRVLMIFM